MFYVAMFGSPCCPGIFHQRKCTGSVMDISPWPPASHRCLRQHPDLLTCRAYRESTSLAAHTRRCDNKPVSPLCVCTDSSTFLPYLKRPLYPKQESQVMHHPTPSGGPSRPFRGACPPAQGPAFLVGSCMVNGITCLQADGWAGASGHSRQPGPFTSPAPCFFSFSGNMMPPKGIKEHLSSTPQKYKAQRTEIKAHRMKQGVPVEESAE